MTVPPKPPRARRASRPRNGELASAVLIEEFRSQMKLVLEAVNARPTREEFRELASEVERSSRRTDLVVDALRLTKRDLEKRFDAVDLRFDAVDQRFDAVDQRLDAMDQRFDAMDVRFDAMDQRFDTMDLRFDRVALDVHGLRDDVARQARDSDLRALEQRVSVLERHAGV